MKLRLTFAVAALLLALGGGFALAEGVLDPAAIELGLQPSGTPDLLGPIAAVGRKGWNCEPEHMAAKEQWKDAGLPAAEPGR